MHNCFVLTNSRRVSLATHVRATPWNFIHKCCLKLLLLQLVKESHKTAIPLSRWMSHKFVEKHRRAHTHRGRRGINSYHVVCSFSDRSSRNRAHTSMGRRSRYLGRFMASREPYNSRGHHLATKFIQNKKRSEIINHSLNSQNYKVWTLIKSLKFFNTLNFFRFV